jgi:hypothetical protein
MVDYAIRIEHDLRGKRFASATTAFMGDKRPMGLGVPILDASLDVCSALLGRRV